MFGKKNNKVKMTKVFTPGGFPTVTYIAREEKLLEERVGSASDNLAKLVVVTGATKSGKTVLVDKVFPQNEAIWVDGGAVTDENAFWELITDKANYFTEKECDEQDINRHEEEIEGNIEGNAFVLKGEVGAKNLIGTEKNRTVVRKRSISSKSAAVSLLQEEEIPLVVDDFHYIDKSIQKNIVRALKAPIMHGLPVIFIAIPNRKYDAVEVEREMTGRIENIEMPVWEENELKKIAIHGFESLNVRTGDLLISKLAHESYGSPFLMQEFCRTACLKSEIIERNDKVQYISSNMELNDIFVEIAEHSGRSVFDKLKRGPRARADRKKRLLKTGEQTDIYGVILEAFKVLKPGIESMSYETLRNNVKELLDEMPPQKNEISRVLDQIAKISYSDTSSTPVIDWQKDDNIITITDPFFAFFLKWAK